MELAPPAAQLEDLVRGALAARYAVPVVRVDERAGTVAVPAGHALTTARDAVRDALGASAAERVVEIDAGQLPWAVVPAPGLRLWRQHARAEHDGELVTELEAGDPPVQVVTEVAGWQLVRTLDGAQGWTRASLETGVPAPASVGADHVAVPVEEFVAEVLRLEGAPYVWGGTTDSGVDCSGLVQRAAWRAGRCWLPRHSRALLGAGRRVAPSAIERGDVLVLKRDPRTVDAERAAQLAAQAAEEQRTGAVSSRGPAVHPMHVAVAVSATEVVHASRDAMRVTREPLAALRERYRVLGVRRLDAGAKVEGTDR